MTRDSVVLEKLERAQARLAAADFIVAFDALLDAWRALRAEQIASLCEMLSQRAARHQPPLTVDSDKKQTERVVNWMNAFHSSTALGLGVLLADLEAAYAQNVPARFIFPRVEALASVRDDPRIATVMVRTAPRIVAGGTWRKFLPQYVRAFHMARDPRFVDALDQAIADAPKARAFTQGAPLGTGSKALKTLRADLLDGPPPLPIELVPIVEAIRTSIAAIPPALVIPIGGGATKNNADGADPATLLADVQHNPDDYELRLVLADALMSVGDPRGEFIVLQCRRANGEDMEDKSRLLSRERALLTEHLHTWIGPLASVVTLGSVEFERGFLVSCEAVATKRVTAEVHFQHAEWGTVRTIRFRGETRITRVMCGLREAFGVDANGLLQLAANGHLRLERLNLNGSSLWTPSTAGNEPSESVRAFAACPSEKLPALAHLELDMPGLDKAKTEWLWKAPWVRQLRSLAISSSLPSLSAWIDELRRRDHLEELTFLEQAHRVIIRKKDVRELSLIVHLDALLPSFAESRLHETLRALTNHRFTSATLDAETLKLLSANGGARERFEQALSRFKR